MSCFLSNLYLVLSEVYHPYFIYIFSHGVRKNVFLNIEYNSFFYRPVYMAKQ